jgi:hypothetical protein
LWQRAIATLHTDADAELAAETREDRGRADDSG